MDLLHGGKNGRLFFFLFCGALGLLLLLLSGAFGKNGAASSLSAEEPAAPASASASVDAVTAFAAAHEQKISALLSSLDGVSDVRVCVTVESDPLPALAGASSAPLLRVAGIAVVCRGGDDPSVQRRILSLLCALYRLPSTRIGISG